MKNYLFLSIFFFCLFSLNQSLSAQDDKENWFEVPNRTLHLVNPTGFGLKKGEVYYQNIFLFYQSISIGFTDYLAIKGAILTNPFFGGPHIITIQPKFTIPIEVENFNLGVASTLMFSPSSFDSEILGAVYGIGTYGNTNLNVSAGLGFGFTDSGLATTPLAMISGQARLSKNMAIISENWLVFRTKGTLLPMISIGLRFMGKNFSLDLAFLSIDPAIIDESIKPNPSQFPFISAVVPIGKK